MPTYLTPGVYVEEVPSANKPIEGVSTSIAAFVGLAPGGPVNTPMRISNWTQFAKIYGDPNEPDNGPFMEGAYLAHSVYGFFQNGGSLCWIVRVGDDGGSNGSGPAARAALPAASDASVETYSAVALGAGEVEVEITEEPSAGEGADKSYTVRVNSGTEKEEFTGLSTKKGRTNLATKVNAQSKLIKIEDTGASLPDTQRAPALGTFKLSAAVDQPELGQGHALRRRRRPAQGPRRPGRRRRDHDGDRARHRQADRRRRRRHAVPRSAGQADRPRREARATAWRSSTRRRTCSRRRSLEWRLNTAGYDSKFAALYYPWIEVQDPLTNQPMMIPPSGHVAGLWCRVDGTRGVHKAPANEVVMGANGLAFQVTHAEQGGLNKVGLNCIRAFPGRGIRVWGARTMSSDPEWRYINVRRLFNFVSESIMEGTQWSVFEPNDEKLWIQLRIAASNFLTRVWSDGALFGSTPAQAFYVKCDSETNPPEVIEAGQVICEIGIAPVKPAEFVIFRLSQFSGGEGSAVAE